MLAIAQLKRPSAIIDQFSSDTPVPIQDKVAKALEAATPCWWQPLAIWEHWSAVSHAALQALLKGCLPGSLVLKSAVGQNAPGWEEAA